MMSFSLSGGVEVLGFISPTDPLDTYPVIDPIYGIDGFRNVDLISDLDLIPNQRRRAGMVVGVSGGTQYYKLNPSPWNGDITDWSTFNLGGLEILPFTSINDFPTTGSTDFLYLDQTESNLYAWDTSILPAPGDYALLNSSNPPLPPDEIPLTFAQAATVGALSNNPVYYNGPSNDGVGAILSGSTNGLISDGSSSGRIDYTYTGTSGDTILIKNQVVTTNPLTNKGFQNGLYTIINPGSDTTPYILSRVSGFDQSSELYPLQVNVLGGNSNKLKYFLQTTVNPTIGTSNIVFSISSTQNITYQIAFVDTSTSTALPACDYASGTTYSSSPGVGATLTAQSVGGPLIIDSLSASTSTTPNNTFNRVLVKDQTGPLAYQNGDYSVVNPGSATDKWQLRRINTSSGGFSRYTRFFIVSNTQSSKAGKLYFTTKNVPALTNATIGSAPINIVEYGGSGTFTGGTVSGVTNFISGLTATTISATTYQNLPTDVNIYNTNGTLTGARSVNLSGNQLTFSSSTTGTNIIGLYGSGNTSTSRTYFEMGQRNNGGFSSSVFFTSFAPNYSDASWGSFYSGSSMLSAYHENPVTTGGFGNLFFDISQFGSTVANRYFAWHAAPVTTARSLSTEMMRLHILGNGDGNLGINTKGVPSQKLHVSGNTLIEGSLTANTISATTYQNLPTDVRVTGGTYSSGTATFTNNTGGTFNVTGFSTNSNGIVGISNSSGLYTYYSTISDAMSAATSGQTIEIFADIIETSAVTVTLKNGVTINGNGHTYILNVSGSTDAFIIPINSTSYMYNINIRLLTSTGAVIRSNPNTILIGNGVLSSNSSSGYVVDVSGANSNLNISGFKIVAESSKNGVFLANGSYADNLTIYSTSGVGLTVGDSARAFDCTVIASSPTSYAAYVYGGLFNSVVYSYGGSNSTAVKLQGSDNLVYPRGLYNCNIISLLGDGLVMENQMDVDNTTVISYGSGKLALKFEITAVSAFTDFNNCTFKSVNGPCVNQVLRWVSFTDCYLFAGSGSCITNSFNNSTYNRVRVRGGFIEVAHNSSSSHGIVLSDNTSHEISSCKFSLANASSYALKSQGASTTAKYLQNTFQGPTTPVDPNVTQGMINTEDVYGNILI